jgi:ribosomal protein L40E
VITSNTCTKCGGPRDWAYHQCHNCHATRMRTWRTEHPQTEEQRRKANARAYTRALVRAGKIEREPCIRCGSTEQLEAHHVDYGNVRWVLWFCRPHHLAHHQLRDRLNRAEAEKADAA